MTYEQGVRLITRAIAIYLFIWILSYLFEVPRELLTLRHELQAVALRSAEAPPSLTESTIYFFRMAIISLGLTAVRVTILLMAARWFMRCGPWLRRFFAAGEAATADSLRK